MNLSPKTPETISIVIPVCNEVPGLPNLLKALEPLDAHEVIFADCGSADGTDALLRQWAAAAPGRRKVLTAPRGRGSQMNAGAAVATGEILLFLHADTELPEGALGLIRRAMDNETVVGGAFRLHIDSPHFFLGWVTRAANYRAAYLRLPYGDQGYFVRSAVFGRMGGYQAVPLMEDVDLIRRLRKEGRIVLLDKAVRTSARRWERQGYFYTSFRNIILLGLYLFGVSPRRLAKWYSK